MPLLFILHLLTFSSLSKTKQSKETVQVPDGLNTILFSLPTTSSRLRTLNAVINGLLLLSAIEFTATPFFDSGSDVSFTRVGAVYPDGAKIIVRFPQSNDTIRVVWRQSSSAPNQTNTWKDGPVLTLTDDQDWLDTIKLSGLWPSTPYECVSCTWSMSGLDHTDIITFYRCPCNGF